MGQWAPTTNMTPPTGNTQSVTVTISTPNTYMVTDNNNCTNTVSVMVTINPIPIITASDATVCPGVNTTLAASGSPAGMGTWSDIGRGIQRHDAGFLYCNLT